MIHDPDTIQQLGQEFLNDVYPGMKKPPNELIKLMASQDVDKTMNSLAILNPPEDPCEVSEDDPPTNQQRKKRSNNGCPKGWVLSEGSCLYWSVSERNVKISWGQTCQES